MPLSWAFHRIRLPASGNWQVASGNLFHTPPTSRKPRSPEPDGLLPKGTKMSRMTVLMARTLHQPAVVGAVEVYTA